MSFTEKFGRQPRALIVAEMAAALLVIAAFDFVTDYRIRLATLYAAPVFVLAWFCGKEWGIAAAVSASLFGDKTPESYDRKIWLASRKL